MNINTNPGNFLYIDPNEYGDRNGFLKYIIHPCRLIISLVIVIYSLVIIGTLFDKINSEKHVWENYTGFGIIIYNLIMGFVLVGVSASDLISSYKMKIAAYSKANSYYIIFFMLGFIATIIFAKAASGYIETVLCVQFIFNVVALVANAFIIGVFMVKLFANGIKDTFVRE